MFRLSDIVFNQGLRCLIQHFKGDKHIFGDFADGREGGARCLGGGRDNPLGRCQRIAGRDGQADGRQRGRHGVDDAFFKIFNGLDRDGLRVEKRILDAAGDLEGHLKGLFIHIQPDNPIRCLKFQRGQLQRTLRLAQHVVIRGQGVSDGDLHLEHLGDDGLQLADSRTLTP